MDIETPPVDACGDKAVGERRGMVLEHSAQLVRDGRVHAEQAIRAGEHFLVVLDEITSPLRCGWVPLAPGLAGLRERPAHVNVVLAGREAPQALIDLADTVTEMRLVTHHFNAGVPAQRRIEV